MTYAGANRTGYSWVQMRADDIPDIFISSQIIDEDLAKERLVTRGDAPLKDSETYRIAFTANSYTEEVGQTYNVQV